jgi:oxygen-dependent protoporphyrinogen oxidase
MKFVVVGAGISGLLLASKLRAKYPDGDITVIDKAPECGGLLAGKYYPDANLYFDLGTHIPRETGDAEIDALMLSVIEPHNLIHYARGQGDYAGAVYNGQLQVNSHFPDIRGGIEHDEISQALKDHIAANDTAYSPVRDCALLEEGNRKFGEVYTRSALQEILPSIYQRPAEDLAWFAAELPGLSRVITDDQTQWVQNAQDDRYRAIIGFPEQRELPQAYTAEKRSFYGQKNGSRALIDGLCDHLIKHGVKIVLSAKIEHCDLEASSLVYEDAQGARVSLGFDRLIIATGIIGAAHILNIPMQDFGFDRPMSHRLINIVADQKINTDLFYFYGLDRDCDFYRVTHYGGILNDFNDKRLTIEVLGERAENDEELLDLIVSQLNDIGFLLSESLSFSDVIKLPSGFPAPTVKNLRAMNDLREEIDRRTNKGNMIVTGVGSARGLFFQNEIIEHGLGLIDMVFHGHQ